MKTVYFNGRIYTGSMPLQQAFAVKDGHFSAVGTNDEILKMQADNFVDLRNAFVCAGFNDSHMHLLNLGQALSVAPLASHSESLSRVLDCLSHTNPGRGGWILGRGWNQDLFEDERRMPDRWDLDKVSRVYPVCAVRACGHALCVNSKALEMLNISSETPQTDGGQIGMKNGHPNGLFFDNAMDLVLKAIPAPNKEEIKSMIRLAAQMLNRYGITSCQSDDYGVFSSISWETINEAYRELEIEGELSVRVYEQANITTPEELKNFINAGNNTGTGTDRFRIGPLKLLGDGALGARTAYLSSPYADDPSTRGLTVFTQKQFDALINLAHSSGMQVAVHCIGDACLDMVLDSIEMAVNENPREDHRHGIVHCQITRPEQLERISEDHLHVYIQSIFLDYDIHIVNGRVGETLSQSSYSWKTLQELGVTVSNGSDCPVEIPDVMAGIQCAVTRCDLRGNGPYLFGEAFSVQQALDSFTYQGAKASFEESVKGKIQPGMLADFVVLGNDPFEIDPGAIKNIPILFTFLDGKMVYQNQERQQ